MSKTILKPFNAKRRVDGPASRSNGERAKMAALVLSAYSGTEGDDLETSVVDLMADVMHLCHREKKPPVFFQQAMRMAKEHFLTET